MTWAVLSNRVIRRRLMVLIRHMEKLPAQARKHFNMRAFIWHGDRHEHASPQTTAQLLQSCGTTACAIGWAATMPYFRKLGLRFTGDGTIEGAYRPFGCGGLWGHLFGGHNNDKTPKAWAKRARAVLADPMWWDSTKGG